MAEHSQETKIAILEAKVDHMMNHVTELTKRVRAVEKVCAIVSAVGIGAGGIVGTTVFNAPKVDASEIKQTHSQPYVHPDNTNTINGWVSRMKAWESEQKMKDAEFDINNALAEFFNNGGDDTTEQEVLLQFSGDRDQQSLGWRYD